MIKVKDLIKNTSWSPSALYGRSNPKISVFLPTFRRAKSGFLKRAINSILGQTFSNFELIVIDDASTDGSKEIIQEYMERDARIHCLTHLYNIGLPAVSEYEAFIKSTGEYIIFAFDDFIFEKDAFEVLLRALQESEDWCCHGLARLYASDANDTDNFSVYGDTGVDQIENTNDISNSTILIKKDIFYKIGLCDPHVLLTRAYDWDLWIRISRYFYIKKIDRFIGSEYRSSSKDSLGSTHHPSYAISKKYMAMDRTQALLPTHYPDFDIAKKQSHLTPYENFYIEQSLEFYAEKRWFKKPISSEPPAKKYTTIFFYGASFVNYYLCFSHLQHRSSAYVFQCFIPTGGYHDLYTMLKADLIIFDREIMRYANIIDLLHLLKIPMYYFIDDNFFVMGNEGPPGFSPPTIEASRSVLQRMDGVLTSTGALQQFFLQHKLHTNVFIYPPSFNQQLLDSRPVKALNTARPLQVAVVGGEFRAKSLRESVLPALKKLHRSRPLILYLRKNILSDQEIQKLPFHVVPLQIQNHYHQFILALGKYGIDLLIHPAGETKNLPYKTNSILLVALYLGANIIVTNEPAFDGLDESQGILNSRNNKHDFEEALQRFSAPGEAAVLRARLERYCFENFNPSNALFVLNKITSSLSPSTCMRSEENHRQLISSLAGEIFRLQNVVHQMQSNPAAFNLGTARTKKFFLTLTFFLKAFFRSFYTRMDLSNLILPSFSALMRYSRQIQTFNKKFILSVSPLLNRKSFLEYTLPAPASAFSTLSIAFGEHNLIAGTLGLEIFLSDGTKTVGQIESSVLDFSGPIVFRFSPLKAPPHSTIKIRLYGQQLKSPVFVYEFRKKGLRLPFSNKQLFCKID